MDVALFALKAKIKIFEIFENKAALKGPAEWKKHALILTFEVIVQQLLIHDIFVRNSG